MAEAQRHGVLAHSEPEKRDARAKAQPSGKTGRGHKGPRPWVVANSAELGR